MIGAGALFAKSGQGRACRFISSFVLHTLLLQLAIFFHTHSTAQCRRGSMVLILVADEDLVSSFLPSVFLTKGLKAITSKLILSAQREMV